jgi:hypothetical protein
MPLKFKKNTFLKISADVQIALVAATRLAERQLNTHINLNMATEMFAKTLEHLQHVQPIIPGS